MITGPSGIGKTRLIEELERRLVRDDPRLVFLRGRCHEKESLRFKAVDGIVDDLSRHLSSRSEATVLKLLPPNLGALLTMFPALSSVPAFSAATLLAPFSGDDPALLRERAFTALRTLLGRLARQQSVVMVLDDFQWADADSVALLRHVFEGRESPPVLLLGLLRQGADAAGEPPELGTEARTLALKGLDRAEARALLVHAVGEGVDGSRLEQMLDETDGHPMLLDELGRAFDPEGPAAPSRAVLDDALLARVSALDGKARQLLEAVCVGGVPLPQGAMAEVAQLSPAQFAERSGLLRGARLARISGVRPDDDVEPYHDRVREAVVGALTEQARVALHRAIGDVLDRRGRPIDQAALHLLAGGERARSAALFARAAADARRVLAFVRAAELYALALEHGEHDEAERRSLLARRAECLRHAGEAERAAGLYKDAAEHGSPSEEERAELLRRAAELWLSSGHLGPGLEVTEALLGHFGTRFPRSTAAALVSLLATDARLGLSSLEPKFRPGEEVPARGRLYSDVLWSTAAGLSLVRPLPAALLSARGAVHALSLGDPHRVARALCACALADHGIGRVKRADRLYAVARRAADQYPSDATEFYLRSVQVGRDFMTRNDFRAVVATVREANELWARFGEGHGWELDTLAQFAHWSLDHLGELEEVRRVVPERIRWARAVGNRFVEVAYRSWFVHEGLAEDRPQELLEDIDAAVRSWLPDEKSFSNPEYLALRGRLYVMLYADDLSAEPFVREQWRRYTRSLTGRIIITREEGLGFMTGFELALARRALERGDQAGARAAIARAKSGVAKLASGRQPMSRATVSLRRAGLAHLNGNLEEADRELAAGIEAADALGLRIISTCASAVRGALIRGDEGKRLLSRAHQFLRQQRFKRPDRLVAAVVPGFGHPG